MPSRLREAVADLEPLPLVERILIPFDKLDEFFGENLAAPPSDGAAELAGSRS